MGKNNKAAKKLNIDLLLFIVTPIVFVSGVVLFVASFLSKLDYDLWMEIHAFSSIPIFYLLFKHIADHWKWYKRNWRSFRRGTRSLWMLSVSFVLSAFSGLVIFFFSGENSLQWLIDTHTILSILSLIFAIQHMVKYFTVILKWVKYKLKK